MTTGTFNYADPTTIGTSKPWSKVDIDATSFGRTRVEAPVADLRAAPLGTLGVDVSGFDLLTAPSAETMFRDDAAVRGTYYAEVESMLQARLSTADEPVTRVVLFDHTVRRRDPDAARQPVQQVHVDQTPGAAEARARRHAPDIHDLATRRFQIINVWRPIEHPATDLPLALVDYRSTQPQDLVAVDLLYPDHATLASASAAAGDNHTQEVRPDATSASSTTGYTVKGETYSVVPGVRHAFYYVRDMRPDEALLIKCFDSHSEVQPRVGRKGVAAYTPHTAFEDPATPAGTPGRQSIEVRALVFY